MPTELWLSVFCRPKGVGEAGIGAGQKKGDFPEYSYRMVRGIIEAVRRTKLAPLDWHHSSGAAIPKAAGVSSKLRLLHVLCPFGSSWYRVRYRRPEIHHVPVWAHGLLRGRSRAGAVVVANVAADRIKKQQISAAITQHDMTNAVCLC